VCHRPVVVLDIPNQQIDVGMRMEKLRSGQRLSGQEEWIALQIGFVSVGKKYFTNAKKGLSWQRDEP